MTDSEKRHDIKVALSLIENVMEDTDEDTWAYQFLEEAMIKLREYFEEYDI